VIDPRRSNFSLAVLSCAAVALSLVGCGGGPAPTNVLPTATGLSATGLASTAAVTTDCGAPSFPCTFDAVDAQVTERSEQIAQDVANQMREGKAPADIEASVRSAEGMAEVEAEADAVRFRLTGGRPEWVVNDPTIGHGAGVSTSTVPRVPSAEAPTTGVAALDSFIGSIVGPNSTAKHGLVLSPFLWDFGSTDDGAMVADVLGKTTGYSNGVMLTANTKPADRTVDVEDFKGWSVDQVVHVVSHGVRLCKNAPCRAAIAVRLLSGTIGGVFVGTRGFELDPSETDETGVDVLHTTDGLTLLALDADFFRHEYKPGLADALIFFNACEIFGPQATDLGDAIRGNAGEFLGWSERVASTAARDAAAALYPLLADGRTISDALNAIGSLATDPAAPNAQLMLGRPVNGDLRIREVVTPRDPSGGQALASGAALPIEGAMSDGQPDDVPWTVTVDGLDATAAAAATLHVAIDDLAAPNVAVSSGTNDTGTHWTVRGVVDLAADLTAPRPATLVASVDLPEGGISRSEVAIVIGGKDRPTGTVWRVHASREGPGDLSTVHETLTIDATVEFAGTGMGNSLQYLVTEGTYSWTYGPSEAGGCVFSATPISGGLTAENTAGSQGLAFYVQGSSISWSVFITFEGGETARTIECGPDSLFESSHDTIHASGSVLFPEPLTVGTLNGNSDTGSYVDGATSVSWTITKIR
jgi:hypothetical protein